MKLSLKIYEWYEEMGMENKWRVILVEWCEKIGSK